MSAGEKTASIVEDLEDQAKGFELYSVRKRKSPKNCKRSSGLCRAQLLTLKPETARDELEQVGRSQQTRGHEDTPNVSRWGYLLEE